MPRKARMDASPNRPCNSLATIGRPEHLTSVGNASAGRFRSFSAQQGGWHESEVGPIRERPYPTGVLPQVRLPCANPQWRNGLLRFPASGSRDPSCGTHEHAGILSAAAFRTRPQTHPRGAGQLLPLLRQTLRLDLSVRWAQASCGPELGPSRAVDSERGQLGRQLRRGLCRLQWSQG